LTLLATAFNDSIGESQNVSQTKGMILLRTSENTTAPSITKNCPNVTYVVNGSQISVQLISDLDTLIYNSNVSVISPSGNTYLLTEDNSVKSSGFVYTKDYTFLVNETGTYNLTSTIEDYEHQNISNSYLFYSAAGFDRRKIKVLPISAKDSKTRIEDVIINPDSPATRTENYETVKKIADQIIKARKNLYKTNSFRFKQGFN